VRFALFDEPGGQFDQLGMFADPKGTNVQFLDHYRIGS